MLYLCTRRTLLSRKYLHLHCPILLVQFLVLMETENARFFAEHVNVFLVVNLELLVICKLTQVLKMHSDLMHPSSLRLAKHDTGIAGSVVPQSLEHRRAVLAFRRHLADADFVAHHFDRLQAFDLITGVEKRRYNLH